ncbi:MAG TPA: DUF3631 domain-containing protein [Nitrospiraceae bacterium]|jgi:phage/plasmid primase-like uncharacterized protein|nr:DUF3631 domain-containing protein [Nitrospiraceae bacterium]
MSLHAGDEFRRALEQAGLHPPVAIPPGEMIRFPGVGKSNGNTSGWAKLFPDGQAGAYGDWASELSEIWHAQHDHTMTATERAAHTRRVAELRRIREEEELARHADAARETQSIWASATEADPSHPYCQREGIQPHGLRVDDENRLIVPVTINGAISSLQFIDASGEKQFLPGGKVKGGTFTMGDLTEAATLLLCEGFATGASLHEATALPTVMAFSANNLHPVAEQLHRQYPAHRILVCGDNDIHADGTPNTGLEAATAAANAIGGGFVMPNLDGQKCDFNDLAQAKGLHAVTTAIEAALRPQPHVLDEVHAFLGRFIAYPSQHAHVAHTLWIAHAHLMDAWESTPRIAFLSPEPASGKTRAIELTETLVPQPVEAVNVSAAYLFRKVSDPAGLPTILFDEIDTVFGPRAQEHEDIRGMLNSGHRRGAMAGRCIVRGKTIETEDLPAFCAVAIAGLGHLPDTILTRSVIIKMRRRAPTEHIQPYRRRRHAPEGNTLRDRLAAWASTVRETLEIDPSMPEGITDRNADVWEALLSVADATGKDWSDRARVAAVALVADAMGDRGSLGVRLLTDLRTLFQERHAMATVDILAALVTLDEAPWGDLKGKPIDSRRLANFLRPYGVSSKNVRIGPDIVKGYATQDLYDPWQRYLTSDKEASLSPSPHASATSATPEPEESFQLYKEED